MSRRSFNLAGVFSDAKLSRCHDNMLPFSVLRITWKKTEASLCVYHQGHLHCAFMQECEAALKHKTQPEHERTHPAAAQNNRQRVQK